MPDGINAFDQSPGVGVTCGDCGSNFLIDPAGEVQNAACDSCGGKRFFRTQPSPVNDDLSGQNILKDMPGAAGSDSPQDTGGSPLTEGTITSRLSFVDCPGCGSEIVDGIGCPNCGYGTLAPNGNAHNPDIARGVAGAPLSEGTIVGEDGIQSGSASTHGYDGYTHSHIAAFPNAHPDPGEMYPEDMMSGVMLCPACAGRNPQCPACSGHGNILLPNPGSDGGRSPSQIDHTDSTHLPFVDIPHTYGPVHQGNLLSMNFPNRDTISMDPYPSLWSNEMIKEGNIFADALNDVKDVVTNPVVDAIGATGLAGLQLGLDPASDAIAGAADAAAVGDAAASAAGAGGAADFAAAGGAGALRGGLAKAAPTIMKGLGGNAVKGFAEGAGRGLTQGGGAPAMQAIGPSPMQNLGSADIPMILLADFETSDSVKSVDEQHDDPEKQDQKEFNDGDKSPSNLENPNNEDSGASGEDGVRDATPGYGFGPNSPAIQHMEGLLPLIMHYLTNGITADDDPMIDDLHNKLESEQPGYLNHEHPDGSKVIELMINDHNTKKSNRLGGTISPVPMPASSLGGLGQYGNDTIPIQQKSQECPICHGITNSDGSCPQCGFPSGGTGMPQGPQQVTSNHQGPITPEQFEAAQQYLEANNQQGLVQQLYQHPENFGWLMNEIQQNPQPTAPLVAPEAAPPAPMEQAPGAMPVIDPSQPGGGGGQPMQPMSALGDVFPDNYAEQQGYQTCKHCGRPLDYKAQLANKGLCMNCLTGKTADANNLVPRCPSCGTASTSIIDGNDGETDKKQGYCPSCQKNFPLVEKTSMVALANPLSDPQAVWSDSNGNPLLEGDQYLLYTAGMPVPDEVTVLAKKPGELRLQLVGTSADFSVQPNDVTKGKYSFEPATNSAAGNNEIPHGQHPLDNANVIPEPTTDQITDQYPNAGTTSHVHEEDEDKCRNPKCGSYDTYEIMASPTSVMHECYRCASVWETNLDDDDYGEYGRENHNSKLDWLKGGDDEDFFAEYERHRSKMGGAGETEYASSSRNIHDIAARDPRLAEIRERLDSNESVMEHIAGKHFTQAEKRDLINETGRARNFDQLNLDNTHYRVDDEYISRRKGNGGDAPDAHLFMGI